MFDFLDPLTLIKSIGLIGTLAVVFAESGLFFGFFLPGDSLLFTAGLLASQGYMNVFVLFLGSFLMAVLGDSVGYAFGKKIGPKIFNREDSFFFRKSHIEKTKKFYEKYGKKTIILARFVPIVRTFAPILAGVGEMEYKTFLSFNIIGGFLWTASMVFAGYFLGSAIPNIDHYVLPITLGIIFVSFIPIFIEFWKSRAKKD